ncbi:MAG: protease inhibitor I9 family protein [Thermoproteota archaeon]|nr:protease inhibitor I9 family protein [Thermoproteota archaeon]
MNSKSRQHAKLGLISLMIFISIFSTSVIKSVDAFNIGLPDIPFFNFNFDSNTQAESSSIIDFKKITNIIPKSNSGEVVNDDNSYSELETAISGDSEGQAKDVDTQPRSTSLPFPSNMMNTVYSNENENTNDINKASSKLPDTLPLIGDYADIPSTFLSEVKTSDDNVIPGQYIVVFKDDDTTVSDFFSMVSSESSAQGIELLQVYESVLNGLAIRVPNDKVIEAIEQLPMVDYVEKDVMAQAFAQTLPSGIDRIDADLSSSKSGNEAGMVDVDAALLDTGIDLNY